MLNGIRNFLEFINNNWFIIVIDIGLVISVYEKVKSYFSKTNAEKVEIAKQQIKEICLKLITDAEVNYEEWDKSGSIKRAQVIQKIFTDYPILTKAINQEEIIEWIDKTIDSSLVELRKIIEENEVKWEEKSKNENEK